ncbi:MAG TPA: Asp-tRNA(Asn)/Glu-tRNA(Gln) amidotransferase subunit GatB [Candidatus Saccharimonadales bacterium]|nr:Asp-tRNA(Asn)/Glu-tRNA(Gln) amidotransferase subunit GatB [Candidatus Saccharimonadales bacterium]
MADWQLTVGMEIHVELETKTKMFCGCPNDPFGTEPNIYVCPICYGLPGALPLINKEAVAMVTRFGQAINAEIPADTFWARKNYFYPDLPKGYQVSQMSLPLVQGGKISIDGTDYHLNHAHLEEDAGKLVHSADNTHSLVNYNRAGVPLLEIVTEPDFHSSEAAKRFCQELQRIMRSLKISSADMEKGQMRCEANISVSKKLEGKSEKLGTKVEVKNINSFRAVEKAINYEFERQTKALEAGETIHGETRGWDDPKGQTFAMRTKETGADYRYFPEPDLPRVKITLGAAASHQLPDDRRKAIEALGAPSAIATALVDKDLDENILELDKLAPKLAKEAAHLLLEMPNFAKLSVIDQVKILEAKQQNGWTKEIFAQVIERVTAVGKTVEHILPEFAQAEDFGAVIQEVLAANQPAITDFKSGKEASFNFLVGQVMAATKGRANIQTVRTELQKALN